MFGGGDRLECLVAWVTGYGDMTDITETGYFLGDPGTQQGS